MDSAARAQSSILDRAIRAARVEDAVYEEVEHDPNATMEAAIVVVVTSLLAGIGSLGGGLVGLILGVVFALIGWAVYAFLAYFIGTRIFATEQTKASWSEVARGLGYAQVPRVFLVLGFIPVLGAIIGLAVFVWLILTTLAALRAALEIDTARAAGTAILAVLAQIVIMGILFGTVLL